ncbi:MAG TPA: hypothetical protein VMT73_02315 [Anaerolineales bacterium]|nr:hypothetical protein [Anaerolineales bacterium]
MSSDSNISLSPLIDRIAYDLENDPDFIEKYIKQENSLRKYIASLLWMSKEKPGTLEKLANKAREK